MWTLAVISVETGIAPNDLMDTDPDMIDTMVTYMGWRAKQQQQKAGR